jgi:hypothetical protein
MPAPPVSGNEWCCWVDPETGAECPNTATWALIDGYPAHDHCLDLCNEHKDGWESGNLYPLVVGELHPCMAESRTEVLESKRRVRNTRKDLH